MPGSLRKGDEKQKIPAVLLSHLPKTGGGQAREEKSVLEVLGFFPGTQLHKLEGYREAEG